MTPTTPRATFISIRSKTRSGTKTIKTTMYINVNAILAIEEDHFTNEAILRVGTWDIDINTEETLDDLTELLEAVGWNVESIHTIRD